MPYKVSKQKLFFVWIAKTALKICDRKTIASLASYPKSSNFAKLIPSVYQIRLHSYYIYWRMTKKL